MALNLRSDGVKAPGAAVDQSSPALAAPELAVRELLTGRVPPGVHFAAGVLDAAETLALLSGDPLVTGVELT
ncbi:hypothetical protein [Actinomadura sp. 3N407]|uniref:hypothetical protein n=1 Tax=Actinomadura sp. 3N407 TaxID=3457423 RepID=UPI003FCD34C3